MWKAIAIVLKWVGKNPWIWSVARQANEFVIKPTYEKYIKPVLIKLKKKKIGRQGIANKND